MSADLLHESTPITAKPKHQIGLNIMLNFLCPSRHSGLATGASPLESPKTRNALKSGVSKGRITSFFSKCIKLSFPARKPKFLDLRTVVNNSKKHSEDFQKISFADVLALDDSDEIIGLIAKSRMKQISDDTEALTRFLDKGYGKRLSPEIEALVTNELKALQSKMDDIIKFAEHAKQPPTFAGKQSPSETKDSASWSSDSTESFNFEHPSGGLGIQRPDPNYYAHSIVSQESSIEESAYDSDDNSSVISELTEDSFSEDAANYDELGMYVGPLTKFGFAPGELEYSIGLEEFSVSDQSN